jgi:predicted ATP-dependent serine protease
MYRRFVQIKHGMSKDQVYEYYKQNDNHLSADVNHIKVMTVSPDLQQIKQVIAQHQPRILVVDTIDCVQVRGVPDFERMKIIPTELHNMAVQYGIIIIGVSHISKKASSTGALGVHSPSGPATIEQRSDIVLGLEGMGKSAFRTLTSHKGRDEAPFRLSMMYDTNTFRMEEVNL